MWGQSACGFLAAMTGATNGAKSFDVGDHLDLSSEVQRAVDELDPADLSITLARSADTRVSPGETLGLQTALRATGIDSTRYALIGAGHGDPVQVAGDRRALPMTHPAR